MEAAPNNARSSCFEYHLWVSLFKRRHHPLAGAITIFRTDFTYAFHRHYPRARSRRVHFQRTPGLFGLIGHYWKSSAAVAARHERASTLQTGTRAIIIIIIMVWRIILLLLLCARVLYTRNIRWMTTVKWISWNSDERPQPAMIA